MSILMDLKPGAIVRKARKGELTVAVIGLGSMGLPTACLFAKKGVRVLGADEDASIVEKVNKGKSPIAEPGLDPLLKKCVRKRLLIASDDVKEVVSESDAILIIVPTSITKTKKPDYSSVERASETIGSGMRKKILVMLESTVGPGVTETIVKGELERASGLKAGEDFGLAYSPIRASIGRVLHDLTHYPRIVAGIDSRSLEVASALQSIISKGGIIKVRNIRTAELSKLFENVYRDVNIALANQLALFCEVADVDYFECMKLATTQPFCHLHLPGSGVGGPCIPVNPYFLIKVADDVGIDLSLLRLSRKVNDAMPRHAVRLVESSLKECRKSLKRARIAVLGLSFKPDVKDTRGSTTIEIVERLQKRGAIVTIYDPFFSAEEIGAMGYRGANTLSKAAHNADCILVSIGHKELRKIDLNELRGIVRMPASIVDCGRIFDPFKVKEAGFIYRGIGFSHFDGTH